MNTNKPILTEALYMRISPKELESLRTLAKSLDQSVSWTVRKIIRDACKRVKTRKK